MVKVTQLRRAERRNREAVAIAKTTPAMTLKRLVRPEQVGDWMSRLNRSLTFDLGIDLGTANILIYAKGKGLVLDEPAYIARDDKTWGDILALGETARTMVGRTPKGISVIRPPVKAGVIADYDMTEFMLKYFIRSVVPASRLMKTRIIVCVPSGITPVEKRAILEALLRTGGQRRRFLSKNRLQLLWERASTMRSRWGGHGGRCGRRYYGYCRIMRYRCRCQRVLTYRRRFV
nr:rod shape-determining protein [Veillonella denticariosi]